MEFTTWARKQGYQPTHTNNNQMFQLDNCDNKVIHEIKLMDPYQYVGV